MPILPRFSHPHGGRSARRGDRTVQLPGGRDPLQTPGAPVTDAPTITVTALCLLDGRNRLLLVRKRGTTMFMQPGGKPEDGETPAETGVRELSEELGLDVGPGDLTLIGAWEGPAANEADTHLVATVFLCPLTAEPRPAAEIEELDWLDLGRPQHRGDLAPLLTDFVIPELLRRRGQAEARTQGP